MLQLKKHDQHSIGLIGHAIADYPTPEKARAAIKIMVEAKIDLIELQIPFSDPVADGPIFVKANQEALAHGVNVEKSFTLLQEASRQFSTPFVLMTYVNIIFKKGYKNFVTAAKKRGAQGIIVPDLPVEEAGDYLAACKDQDVAFIPVVPSNISDERLAQLIKPANGFVYAVARAGVTGAATHFDEQIFQFLSRIRQHTDLPIAVGFGITKPEDITFLKPIADYAIVGTQALRVLLQEDLPGLRQFWQNLHSA